MFSFVCEPCTRAQHDGCGYPKSCSCQHRPAPKPAEPLTGDPKDC